ncbi:hypothetical protein ABK040_013861 [Willaertia magna]
MVYVTQFKNLLINPYVIGSLVCSLIFLFFFPRFAQPTSYHDYADKRACFNIPYCYYVLSNLPFVIVGLLGLHFLHSSNCVTHFRDRKEITIYKIAFFGILFGGFGSAYYHMFPNNMTLFWDRLPMNIAITALFSAMLAEGFSIHNAYLFLFPMLAISIASVIHWEYTEMKGNGDLRFYLLCENLPALFMTMVLWKMTKSHKPYTNTYYWWMFLAFGLLSKVTESMDKIIFTLTFHTVSGHVLKHIFLGIATCYVYIYIRNREIIGTKLLSQSGGKPK